MIHIPITEKTDQNFILEFSHFNKDAPAGFWKKENLISLPHIKINVFVEGSFSFFTSGENYTPTYGDVCVLPPHQIHSAQITKQTRTNYYQFDIGLNVFDGIPDGKSYIEKLIVCSTKKGVFFRPKDIHIQKITDICRSVEDAIRKENRTVAYIKTMEFVTVLCEIYASGENVEKKPLSLVTQSTLQEIEQHFDSRITIEQLAKNRGVSCSYLSRIFKKEIGTGIHAYINNFRVVKASYFLKEYSVAETCYMCGFSDSSHFISIFKKHFKCTPFQYKKHLETSYIN